MEQKQYDFLLKEKAPKVLVEALKLYGTKEGKGTSINNPEILGWAKELGITKIYTNDSIAWCGLFVATVINRAGYTPVKDPLWARNWSNFGTKQTVAKLGDILVFKRETGGHVGIYVGEDATCYHVLGGNQADMVNITRILKTRCISINRCTWKIAEPDNVRVIKLKADGNISTNEA